jgi:hypothetical protein
MRAPWHFLKLEKMHSNVWCGLRARQLVGWRLLPRFTILVKKFLVPSEISEISEISCHSQNCREHQLLIDKIAEELQGWKADLMNGG